MPRINRLRIVNFRYDDDKKLISNELYEFGGKNALINLENGGGKSVILQLALQVVLPNTNMGSRNFSHYFKTGTSPTHIMVEWKLDGTGADYVLTGICVSGGTDGLRFFTYTHFYKLPHDLDIKGLEAINREKQVIGFSEYYNYLKRLANERRLNLNIYSRDRQREYRDKLYTFNLFREEFDAIKIINQTEGGIDKFFENARKSRNVIEKLIIPNIPQAEGETSGLLVQTLKKHLDNLKNIPVYQHKIKTYEAFCDRAEELLSKLNDYGTKVEEIDSVSRDILALSNIIGIAAERLEKEVESLKNNEQGYAARIEELLYKKDSLDYTKRVLEMENLEERHEQVKREIEKISDKIQELDREIRYKEAASFYDDIVKARNEVLLYREQLESLSKEKDEIHREYQNYIYHAKILLGNEIKGISEAIEDLKRDQNSLLKEKKGLQEKLDAKNKERDEVKHNISAFETKLEHNKERQSQIEGYFVKDVTLLADPRDGLEKIVEERDGLLNSNNNLKEEIDKANREIDDLAINENRLKEALAASRQRKESIEEEIKDFERKFAKINKEISMYEIDDDVYSNKTMESLNALKLKMDNSLRDVLFRYREFLNRKNLHKDSEYYIPDAEIKKVYDLLVERGIRCIPGSLWLRNQREDLKEAFLHKNPLLSYSIVIEKRELEKIMNGEGSLLKEVRDLVESYPVTFVVDCEQGILTLDNEDIPKSGIDRLGAMEAYVVYSKNNSLVLNTELFKQYLKDIDQRILGLDSECEGIKKDVEKITGLIERCREFVSSYPKGYIKELKGRRDALLDDIKNHEDNIQSIQERRDFIHKSKIENQKIIEANEGQIKEKEQDIDNLKEYMKLRAKISELAGHCKTEQQRLNKTEKEKKEIEERIDSVSKEIEDARYNLREYSRTSDEKKKLFDGISARLTITEPVMHITGTLDEILSKARGLETSMDDSGIDQVRNLIENWVETEKRGLNQIRSKGFTEADFEGKAIHFNDEMLEEERKQLDSLKKDKKGLDENERRLFGEIKELGGKTEQLEKDILNKYKNPPCIFDSLESVDETAFEKQIDAFRRKRQNNTKKLEDTERRRNKLVEHRNRLEEDIEEYGIKIQDSSRENMDSLVYNGETVSLWDILRLPIENIVVIGNEKRKRYKAITKNLDEMESRIKESYDKLYNDADWAENGTIRLILEKIMKNDMYNYKYVEELFNDILKSVENMKKATQFQLDESLKDKDEIVERCYSKAERVYEEIKSVDGFSKIKMDGVNRKTINIEMPALHREEGRALMNRYIEDCINEIEKMKEEGRFDPAKIDNEIAKMMSPARLLDAVTSLNEYTIKVFKPEAAMSVSRYIPWEVVINWSGGEKLAGFFAMFISIISYLRYKKAGWQGSSKVIWIDNPFGQANAGYLLSYIFELANATNTQMICLTGHMQVDIYMQFDVVYSLVHRMLAGMNMSVIRSKLIKSHEGLESAAYKVQHEQMKLF